MASGSGGAYALPSAAKDRRIHSAALRSTARMERSDPTQRRERHRRIVAAALKATLRPRSEAELKQTYKKKGDQRHAPKRRSAAAQTIPKTLFCRARCPLSFAVRQMIQNNVFCIPCSTPRPPEIFPLPANGFSVACVFVLPVRQAREVRAERIYQVSVISSDLPCVVVDHCQQ